MQVYEVRRKLIDGVNGFVLPRGAFVTTDEDLWVKRFGVDLKIASVIPNGVKPTLISDTLEGITMGISEASDKAAEVEPVDPSPKVERTAMRQRTRGPNKAVLNEDSDNKG
ncbi:MAG: hypothetical protein DRN17_07485 [Thermoplasmata archaeon]|nr:MAG: hypothetical protein DRN17_07485 [Thermoplasmata archaeon]